MSDLPLKTDLTQVLLEISKKIAEHSSLPAMFDDVMATVVKLVQAQRGFILTLDPTGAATPQVVYDRISNPSTAMHELSMSIVQEAIQTMAPVHVNDALADPTFSDAQSVRAYQIRSVVCVPLISREEVVGAIYVENRAKANVFKAEDVETLQILAAQIAVSIHNSLLHDMLKTSRENIVIAREEERRMLRRELHDSLGPRLSGMILELGTAIVIVQQQPDRAITQLTGLNQELQQAVNDLRQLARNLRPPALDDLGLVESLQAYLQNKIQPAGLKTQLYIEPDLPTCSAAMEVAIYRITTEALTNCLKYAEAHMVSVSLAVSDDTLILTIQDDGVGLPDNLQSGVGLLAMRERTEEIGGVFYIGAGKNGGTQVQARFGLN